MPQAQGSIPNAGSRTMVGNKLQKKCMKCKKEVDDEYSACPHCGNNTFE
jgi:rRNA maturation endonuclease Nob1